MISVRRSAMVWTTAALTAVGLVAFVIAHGMARHEAADFLDGQLRQIALNIGTDGKDTIIPTGERDPEDIFLIDLWTAQGRRVGTPATGDGIPLLPRPGLATVSAGGEEWRVCRVDQRDRIVQVSQRMVVQTEMAEDAALQAGLPVLIAIPLAWLVMGWGLTRVFARLMRVERAIAVRSTDSAEPIPVADVPKEVLPLVLAMNDLIGRIHVAMERQRRFVGDAAHQLRTPLAALLLQIGNLALPDSQSEALAEMESGIRRAARLVDQLLRMARLEEEHLVSTQIVDLTALGDHGGQ
ncbi:MAG: histidine kinase, partial [Magnetospirillum sp.]